MRIMLHKTLFLAVLWIISISFIRAQENSVQAVSEGSDCRCKCILTTKDGGLCEGSLVGGQRKIIYLVETISGGTDCRCSCNTPPPGGCDTPATFIDPDEYPTLTKTGSKKKQHGINLVELHSSISNMVAAMVKLEKAVTEKSSEDDLDIMRENIKKVVSNLKSTNGSYQDLLDDLELETEKEQPQNGVVEKNNVETTPATSTVTLSQPTKSASTSTTEAENVVQPELMNVVEDKIGVAPLVPTSTSQSTSAKSVKSPTTTTQTTTESTTPLSTTRTTTTTTISSIGTIKPPLEAPEKNVTTTAQQSITPKQDEFDTTKKLTTERHMPTSRSFLPPVKPKILFEPYRAVRKKPPPTTAKPDPTTTTPLEKEEEYEYDYDEYFDVDDDRKKTTKIARLDHTTTTHTAISSTSPSTTISGNSTTTTTTSTTTESDDLYSDYLDEYEDEIYNYDEIITKPTTTTTTTTQTTTTVPKIDPCGTLFSFSKPRQISRFGRREGAWMRDPVPSTIDRNRSSKIYVANFYYGSNLIEFDSVEAIKELRYTKSYNLPHKYIGTGHLVYNGSFYYNRAFSRTLIKYNLRYRFVSAWSHLTNAVYDSTTPFTWRGHSMVHVVADEDGLWVIFPARDPFNPHSSLTYVINKINPVDLRILESHKSKIRQTVSHVFMICGVVYSTDRYNSRNARVTHAFDTKTQVQRSFYIGFENLFSYTVQFSYNPKERKIYAWDNGRQVEYRVTLMH